MPLADAFGVLVRDAVAGDVPALVEVQRSGAVRALAHIFPQQLYPFPCAAIQQRWAAEIANPNIGINVSLPPDMV